nr:hypothetical protein [Tanacetum cinerariifolium]
MTVLNTSSKVDKVNEENATQGSPKASSDQPSSCHFFTYANVVNSDQMKTKVNFRLLESDVGNVEANLVIPMASVQEVNARPPIPFISFDDMMRPYPTWRMPATYWRCHDMLSIVLGERDEDSFMVIEPERTYNTNSC